MSDTPVDLAEYQSAYTGVAICDRSDRSKIELRGRDRRKFLANLCTNDIQKLDAGTGCEAFLLNAKGKILDYVTVYQLEDSIFLDAGPGRGGWLLQHFDMFLFREDVTLFDRTADCSLLHILGPRAATLLSGVCDLTGLEHELSHGIRPIGGVECHVRRCARSTEQGFDLMVPKDRAGAVEVVIRSAGASLGLRTISVGTIETLRIEAGIPVYGIDITDDNFPQEVGRDERTISFTKGCYIGQETVARIDAYGHVNRRLAGLRIAGTRVPAVGSEVELAGGAIGALTSSTFSPRLGQPIALALLRANATQPGTSVAVKTDAGPLTAVVHSVPIVTCAGG